MSTYALKMLASAKPAAAGALAKWNATTKLWDPLEKGSALQVLRVNAGGTDLEFASGAGGGADTALSNIANVAIPVTIASDTDNTDDLGTTTIGWRSAFLRTRLDIRGAASDTHPKASLGLTGMSLGAGGGLAADVTVLRTAAGVLEMGAGQFLRILGATVSKTDLSGSGVAFYADTGEAEPRVTVAHTGITFTDGASASSVQIYLSSGVLRFSTLTAVAMYGGIPLRLYNADASYVGLVAPAGSLNNNFILPAADGAAGQGLKTDGGRTLGWSSFLLPTPATDNDTSIGTAAKRYINVATSGSGFQCYTAASDANAASSLTDSAFSMGAGGGTALDTSLSRAAAGVWQTGLGHGIRLRGASSGYVGQVSPSAPTSWTWTWPTTAPSTNNALVMSSTAGIASFLPMGSALHVLRVNAGATALEFAAASGAAADVTLAQVGAAQMVSPTTSGATFNTANDNAYYEFSASATNIVYFTFVLPRSYSGTGTLKARLFWTSVSTSNNTRWGVSVDKKTASDAMGTDSYDTENTSDVATDGVAGDLNQTDITLTTRDSLVVGDVGKWVKIRVQRLGAHANDTATGIAKLYAVEIWEDV